jgi:hypothetical protein
MPFAGITWLTMPYVVGLERLGFEAYYVEAHAIYPRHFHGTRGEGAEGAAAFIDRAMRYFGMPEGRFAFHALHGDESVWGMSDTQLRELYRSAALIINLHGGTLPLPEHYATGRLELIDTDPVGFQVDVYNGDQEVIDYLEPHCAFFTWGTNFGQPDCGVPQSDRFIYEPTRMPILIDRWQSHGRPAGPAFTTIGNWSQGKTDEVVLDGELYTWSCTASSKVHRPPGRSGAVRIGARKHRARRPSDCWSWLAGDRRPPSPRARRLPAAYRRSRGEFTVARTEATLQAMFSDGAPPISPRAAGDQPGHRVRQLAADRRRRLLAFSTTEDVLEALEAIDARTLPEIAREYSTPRSS